MKNGISRDFVHNFVKHNSSFAAVIILQTLFILVSLLQAIIEPQYIIRYTVDDYILGESIQQVATVDSQNDKLIFDKTESQYYMRFRTVSKVVPSGSYELKIDYNSDFGTRKNTEDSTIFVEYCTGVTGNDFILDGAHNTLTSPFWIKNTAQLDDFYVNITFTGAVQSEIRGISVTENVAYRFLKILFYAIIFVIFDVVWWALFSKGCGNLFSKKILAMTAIVLLACLPYLSSLFYEGHDVAFHAMRIQSVAANLASGQFPVRMMYDMCNGYGYPNSIFYCDIFLYLPAVLFNMGLALHTCFKIYGIAVTLFTAVITYFCAYKITDDDEISVLASALYVFSAYRIVCVYTRTAVGEYTAMAFFPLVVLGMYLIYTKDKPVYKDWLPLSIGMSGILMSHILSTEIVGIILIIFVLFNIRKTLKFTRIVALVKAASTTFMLCLWFVIPFVEYYLTQTTKVSQTFNNIGPTSAYPLQLFALLYPATGININNGMKGEMGISIGLTLVIAAGAVAYYCINRDKWSEQDSTSFATVKQLSFLSAIALLFSSKLFPWEIIQNISGSTIGGFLGSIQFVWRYLSAATVLLCFAGIVALKVIKQHNRVAEKVIVFSIIIGLIFNVGYYYYQFGQYIDEWPKHSYSAGEIQVGTGEYYLLATDQEQLKERSVNVVSGEIDIVSFTDDNGIRLLQCNNTGTGDAVVEIPVFSYKYYQTTDMETGAVIEKNHGSNNRIAIIIPKGYNGTIQTLFVPPVHWRIAEIISLATFLCGCIAILVLKKRHRNI